MARASTAIGLGLGLLAGAGVVALALPALVVWDRARLPGAEEPPAVAQAPVPTMPDAAADIAADTAADADVLRFDLVRVDPESGLVTVAGIAEPGARVGVLVDGVEAETVTADHAGSFAVLFALEPSAAPRAISLAMQRPDGSVTDSADTLLISATPPRPVAAAAQAMAGEGSAAEDVPGVAIGRPDMASEAPAAQMDGAERAEAALVAADAPRPPAAAQAGDAPHGGPRADESAPPPDHAPTVDSTTAAAGAPAPQAEAEAQAAVASSPSPSSPTASPPSPSPPTVVLAGERGVRVLHSPDGDGARGPAGNVVVDAISYSAAGAVELAGRATAGAAVRLYLDNRPMETVPVGAGGAWQSALPEVDTGVYTLRVDEIDADGAVVSRFETPFRREDPARLAAAAAVDAPAESRAGSPAGPPRARVVTVQPGYTLWGISERTYGSGFLFVQVFEANRDQIRDPDLIYPGQVFALPEIADPDP